MFAIQRFEVEPGLFMMRGRRHGESLFHWGYCCKFVVSAGHP
jgi:hypothetical protein